MQISMSVGVVQAMVFSFIAGASARWEPTRNLTSRFGPAQLPADVTNKLNTAIVAALKEPRMRTQLENEGATPAPMSAVDFAAFVRDDVQRWAPIVKQSGARPD